MKLIVLAIVIQAATSAFGPFSWVLERPRVLRFKPCRG
jgi:hypothetical protein